jgi:hypothetical protein
MSLLLDGYEVQREVDGVYLSIARGRGRHEIPSVRARSSLIPFRHGRRHELGIDDVRLLELVGSISKPVTTAFVAEVDKLKGILTADREPWAMIDTLPDGQQRWINVVGRNAVWQWVNPHTLRLSAELEAHDPFWYSVYGISTLDSGLLLDNGEALDQGGEVVVTPTSTSHPLALDTLSTADVEAIRLRMTGPSVTAPGIEVDTPDGIVGFVLAAALTSGQELEVVNATRTAFIGLAAQRQNMILRPANRHGEYVRFRPGLNTVRILGQPTQARLLFPRTFL